jgi:hypothetical protein
MIRDVAAAVIKGLLIKTDIAFFLVNNYYEIILYMKAC